MKYETKPDYSLGESLRQLPQVEVPQDVFANVQSEVLKKQSSRGIRFLSFGSIAAVVLMSVMFFKQTNELSDKDELIQKLVERTIQLEALLESESLTVSDPGSVVTEKIVNMEAWLAKLDKDIQQTKDKQKLKQLMAAKVTLLKDIVQLQRSMNIKPDFQKVKPFVI